MGSRRLVVLGLDGMPYELIRDLAAGGTMPHTGRLIAEGAFRKMTSSVPEVSSVAWSSIITGSNPGVHGIYGFTDLAPGSYRVVFPSFRDLGSRPFWETYQDKRSVVLNVPSTFPARPMNGVHIAGFVALDLERATYPPSLVPRLKEMDYQVDVDSQTAHQSLDLFLRNLDRALERRAAVYRYLWNAENWDIFVLVFTGTDRLGHFLWDAYEDQKHRHHQAFLDHLHKVDQIIGEIVEQLADDDVLIVLSDHGFEALEADVYLNAYLKERDFLRADKSPRRLLDLADGTVAFVLDPSRVYVNWEGRYPKGAVAPHSGASVLDDLVTAFSELEVGGKPVVRKVFRREELYHGARADRAPDLVLLPHTGFNLRGSIKAERVVGRGVFTGKHSQDNAFLLVRSGCSACVTPAEPSVWDVAGVIRDTWERTSGKAA